MSLLRALRDANALRPLDDALARTLQRLAPDTPDAVLAAAALASLAVSRGHAGLALDAPGELIESDAVIAWPDPAHWRGQLAGSRWIATPSHGAEAADAGQPLVLEPASGRHGLLYLRRYREYERRLAAGLRRIGASRPDASGIEALGPLFGRLFPGADAGDDRQARAAALALRHALLLVTGGPGTGKTTTIARLLVLLAGQAAGNGAPPPRIALAAPTGRAAERMAESVRDALARMRDAGVDAGLVDALPAAGTTLHRLLGTIPDAPDFRHGADNPLPLDVVVVDEASMVDLPLMAKLVEAVPDGARVVLIGDPDQLPSVEAGDVLAAILQAAGPGDTLARDDAVALAPLLGDPSARHPPDPSDRHPHDPPGRHPREGGGPGPSPATAMDSRLRGNDGADMRGNDGAGDRGNDGAGGAGDGRHFPGRRVHLVHGHRQHRDLQLAPLADAVRAGDAAAALVLLRANALGNVQFHDGLADPLLTHRDVFLAHWRAMAEAASPGEALALANRLRLLTAVREGPQGANGLNARIEALLTGTHARAGRTAGPHFHGRLLLITRNSYPHRLFNGDIGICFRNGDGTLMAWFPGDTPDAPRAFHPASLPAHQGAFAMTVHKAQGSEFDTVWLLLPARPNRVLSRELVYTGLTRARSALHVAGSADVLQAALSRHASRWSGLGWRLGAD
jgi:exodeoxyribonuclease V alpha subunit